MMNEQKIALQNFQTNSHPGCGTIPVQMIELHQVFDIQHDCSSDFFLPNFKFSCQTLVLHIYQTEASIWQAVTWNLGMGYF